MKNNSNSQSTCLKLVIKKKKSWNSGKNDSQLNYQKQCKPEDSTGLLEVLKNYQPSILYSMYSEI